MKTKRHFSDDLLAMIHKTKITRLRAGILPHRFIAIWAVVVEKRVFVRSWSLKPRSWYRAFLQEPRGAIQINGAEIPIRAMRTRSERLKDAIDEAYGDKYNTPGSIRYVRDLSRTKSRNTTTELVPR